MNLTKAIRIFPVVFIFLLTGCQPSQEVSSGEGEVGVWVTSGDRTTLLKEKPRLFLTTDETTLPTITLDPVQKFQTVDGFGFALTGGSAMLMNQRLTSARRDTLLNELFGSGRHSIGISYLRISLGSSDLDDHPFTYDDVPRGRTDTELKKFSLKESTRDLIPILKKIIALSPDLKIMSSPWSAPAWMKSNHSLKGGSLRTEFYDSYARYFVKYIKAMQAEGIRIDAITLQNEPENPKNNPSMVMTATEEALFIKDFLGPHFQKDSITTKIVVFDHNCDHPEYPIAVLDDVAARKFIDGAAFHLYLGAIDALSQVHQAHPDANLYFTEQWTSPHGEFGGDLLWHTRNLTIGAMRNWSKNIIEWNLAADPAFNPHTPSGGCTECLGALTIGRTVTRNVSYYIIAQASKFVRPGAVRIASTVAAELSNVAFVNPDGSRVLIVLNEGAAKTDFAFRCAGKTCVASLPGKSVGTFIW